MIQTGDMVTISAYNKTLGEWVQSMPVRVMAVNQEKGLAYLQGFLHPVDFSILTKVCGAKPLLGV